jgi:hypothetical protein
MHPRGAGGGGEGAAGTALLVHDRGFHMHWHAPAAPARWGLVLLSLSSTIS